MGDIIMKACSKCKIEYKATAENFGPHKGHKDGLQSRCRVCDRAYQRGYRQTIGGRAYRRAYQGVYQEEYRPRYFATVSGHLRRVYYNMTTRCTSLESYVNKGIRNLFKSPDDLIDYVVNVLKVDPRGLDCHRPDNDGHYERGNITFIGHGGHTKLHKIGGNREKETCR